jgi:hypothetical protein
MARERGACKTLTKISQKAVLRWMGPFGSVAQRQGRIKIVRELAARVARIQKEAQSRQFLHDNDKGLYRTAINLNLPILADVV